MASKVRAGLGALAVVTRYLQLIRFRTYADLKAEVERTISASCGG